MTGARPGRLVLVCGTGTEVGKTWTACRLAELWRDRGLVVAARKPAQSAWPGETTDAEHLAAATGESPSDVCPSGRTYDVAMAPPMAAEVLGQPRIALADLVDEIRWPEAIDVGLVETAGGVRSPLADDGDALDLGRTISPDVVLLVAHAALGVINAVRLSVDALAATGAPVVVFLNHHRDGDDLHERNRAWLAERCALPVETGVATLAARLLTVVA